MGKLGYSSITLTDLTETIPVNLILETNQNSNIQTKIGNLFTPDFSKKDENNNFVEELIITPSLFLGNEEINLEKHPEYVNPSGRLSGFIYYQIGKVDENGKEINYYYNASNTESIYVDILGCLHIRENLSNNITIEAYIDNFHNAAHNYTIPLVQATNPINFLLLEDNGDIFSVIIETNGRQHFEETKATPIILTATLYQGTQPFDNEEELSYRWYKITDGTDNNWTTRQLEVSRNMVYSEEKFLCEITMSSTGITYSGTIDIWDQTENYDCTIVSNRQLLLSENFEDLILTANVYDKKGTLIESKDEPQENGYYLTYQWGIAGDGDGQDIDGATNRTLEITNASTFLPKSQSFIIYCKVFNTSITGLNGEETITQITSENEIIQFIPEYDVKITPRSIFVPVSNDGEYQGAETYSFTFQLLDKEGNLIDYDLETSKINLGIDDDGTEISFTEPNNGKWDFNGTIVLSLGENTWWKDPTIGSKSYSFTYVYRNQQFSEQIEIIKNKAGADGEQGFSGYTIDLSNEFHAFAGGEMRADSDQSTTCTISAYFGDEKKKIQTIALGSAENIIYDNTKSGEDYPIKISQEYILSDSKGALYISSAEGSDTNEVIITIRTNTSGENEKFLMGIEPIKFFITIEKQNQEGQSTETETLTFFKTFTYTINYNGKSYELNLSENNIKYSEPTNTYSPNQITISALCRETNGVARTYSEGKIIYSIDKGQSWKYYKNSPIVTNSGIKLESIMIRLYSSLAKDITSNTTLNNDLLNKNSKYLLDTETIHVLTSMEGYEFGGENLIKWSKIIPLETNKWSKTPDTNLTISQDGDFAVMNLYSNDSAITGRCFRSPKINLLSEYIGKSFVFSCMIKVKSDITLDDEVSFGVAGSINFSTTIRNCYKIFGSLNKDNIGSMNTEETWETNKWIKVYKIFKLEGLNSTDNKDSDNNALNPTPLENCKYFNILFYLNNNGNVQIKQPKLELGNVPSAWSPSPYDLNTNDLVNYNLIETNSLKKIINAGEKSEEILVYNLKPETYYTFSCQKAYWDNVQQTESFYCGLGLSQGEQNLEPYGEKKSFTFSFDEPLIYSFLTPTQEELKITSEETSDSVLYKNISFLIYFDKTTTTEGILTLEQIKLEEGQEATSFFLSENYLTNLGNDIFRINSISKILEEKVDDLSFITSNYFEEEGYLKQLQANISINTQNVSDPYIEISTYSSQSSSDSNYFSIKITDERMSFLEGKTKEQATEIAYLSNQQLMISRAKFLESFYINDLLVKVTENGVGFLW